MISATAFSQMKAEGKVNRVLVIAPLSVAQIQWPAEMDKWDVTEHLSHSVLHGTASKKREAWEAKSDMVFVNPEGLGYVESCVKEDDFFDALIVDESTQFKKANSLRMKRLRNILPRIKHRVILTGSPVAEKYEGLWPQIFILDDGERLDKYITRYRNKYFTMNPFVRFQYRIKDGAEDEINEKIADIVMRMGADDYLDMPEVIYADIPVPLPPEAQEIYDELLKNSTVNIDGEDIVCKSMAAKLNKLRQISGGFVYLDDGTAVKVHEAKLNALRRYLTDRQGSPVIIGIEYEAECKAIAKILKCPSIVGGTKSARKKKIIEDWNAGKIPVLVGHPASMGHGLNLQYGGSAVLWYTLPWSYELYDQFNRRLNRAGQEKTVTIHHMLTDMPEDHDLNIDKHVMETINRKEDVQEDFFEFHKEGM